VEGVLRAFQFYLLRASVAILCVTGSAFSQAQISSGNIKGRVTDPTGAVIAGAAVVLTNIETGIERNGATDGLGEFRFFVLPPGSYELRMTSPGFATLTRRPIQVTIGQTVIADGELQPAGVQQEVLVQEQSARRRSTGSSGAGAIAGR
jgi:hypothetical protein